MARLSLQRGALVGIAAGAALALAPTALATFPGDNGVIAFEGATGPGGGDLQLGLDGAHWRQPWAAGECPNPG